MDIVLYDNLRGKKIKVEKDKKIIIFNCGPTVSDFVHIGHFRNALLPDVLKRVLNENGYKEVIYITNVSNISLKIYNRSKNINENSWEYIGEYFTQQWIKDLTNANILSPNIILPDTRHLSSIIRFIQHLIDENVAYVNEKGVLYNCSSLNKLINMKEYKNTTPLMNEVFNNNEDFYLWELVDDSEMTWESPWGNGRPGKHIPCSDVIDLFCDKDDFIIHCAGNDLYYHHSCEIAQNIVGNNGCLVSDVWMYNSLINVGDSKMGKSLGNSIPIREILKKFKPNEVRYYLLSTNFDKDIKYNDKDLVQYSNRWKMIEEKLSLYSNEKIEVLDKTFYIDVMKVLNNNIHTENSLKKILSILNTSNRKETYITAIYLLRVLGFEL